MPLLGDGHSDLVRDEAPYFRSLAELDIWFVQPHDKLFGVVPYLARPHKSGDQSGSRGKLLVCHDYKGGYNELPSGLCYTFNFWRLCDTFVYFSHHRVTVPPSGWTNSAHKQGTRILGTLIFEGRDNPDCIQLLVGCADFVVTDDKIPISRRYAIILADLAYQRGFDGYLLNFESHLQHKTNHAHALAKWILLLKSELRMKIGPHAQVVWYDSVIYNGRVSYQNRLNGYNLPFFLASDALFTNYWWCPETQDAMTQYFMNIECAAPDPRDLTDMTWSAATKTLQDVFSGVDVFPRDGGCYQYGCGFTCYRAISHTSPRGFSTALFAPGWTWEDKTENAEENWDIWWDNERKLWLGPLESGEIISVPVCLEGPFKPMTAFFQDLPPPDPFRFMFYTQFSPGVGYAWFVEGRKVLDTKKGWTDIDKQNSIGNLVWPWPTPFWQGNAQDEVPVSASTALDMTDGYNGGNTLKLTLTCAGNKSGDTIRVIWLPVQSLTVATRKSFETNVVFKTTSPIGVDLKVRISARSLSEENDSRFFTISEATVSDMSRGWLSQTISFTSTASGRNTSVAVGFLIDVRSKELSADTTFSLSVGQLAVYPTPPPPEFMSVGIPSVTGAKFTPSLRANGADSHTFEGDLTWDTVSTFNPIDILVDHPESIIPAWLLEDTPAYRFPTFVYFNVYVAPLDDTTHPGPANAVFIGTTGLDGRANRFHVEPACLPSDWDKWAGARLYVQGVTYRGEVLPWERCATVDYRGPNPGGVLQMNDLD